VTVGADDPCWEAFVAAMLPLGPLEERRSRYADKPALFLDGREIAHLEAPGVIDLRITRPGWLQAQDNYREDPAVCRDSSRRDWLGLALRSAAEIDRLAPLLTIAVAANLR
jgi:hypothetical protein